MLPLPRWSVDVPNAPDPSPPPAPAATFERLKEAVAVVLATPWLPWAVAGLATLLLLIALMGWRRALSRGGRASRQRQHTAQRGETDAEALFVAEGFEILERQAVQRWNLWVDQEPREVIARADFLVTREGRTYVADVKTGSQAPDPALPATRRQMLEYLLAFQADGVLVVDMEHQEILHLDFSQLLTG